MQQQQKNLKKNLLTVDKLIDSNLLIRKFMDSFAIILFIEYL